MTSAAEYQNVLEIFDGKIPKPDFFPEAVWTYSTKYDELSWNTDSDVKALKSGHGETYSLDYVTNHDSFQGYTLFTGKNSFGDNYQIIVKDVNRHE